MNEIDYLSLYKGFSALSEDDQNAFIDKQVQAGVLPANWTWSDADKLYRNKQYIDRFGIDAFRQNKDFDSRNNEFLESIVDEAYVDDPNLDLIKMMTPEGKIELLENNKYLKQGDINTAVENAKTTAVPTFTGPGMMPVYNIEDKSNETEVDLLNKNNAILDAVYTRDIERKKESISTDINKYYYFLNSQVQSGKTSIEEIRKSWEQISQGTYYQELKSSTTFKDFSDSDILWEMATFMAASNKIDDTTAWQMIRNDMQNYTNEHMPLSNWRDAAGLLMANTIFKDYFENNPTKLSNFRRDVNTQMWSDIGSFAVAVEGMTKLDEEARENWLNGLDEEGNPLPNWRNPQYWQGVNQYNTTDAEMIKRLQSTGGVSPYVNVTQAGDELEFFNLTNISNNLSQAIGQALPTVAIAAMTNGASLAAQSTGSVLSKVALYTLYGTGKVLEIASPAIGGAHREGYEAYQNSVANLTDEVTDIVNKDIKSRITASVESEQGQKEIQNIMNLLEEEARKKGQYYTDREALKDIATQQYQANLEKSLRPIVEQEHRDKGTYEAIEDASNLSYTTTFGIHAFKNIAFDLALDRVFMSKSTRDLFSDNSLLKFKPQEYIDEAGNVAIKELTKKQKFANMLIEGGEQFFGEMSDAWVNSLGESIGLHDFNDFISKTYDPNNYVALNDTFFNHVLMGLNDLPDNMFTREALFEGWAGLISAFAPGINPDVFTSEGRGKSFRQDAYGNQLGFMESLNKYVTNPLMGAYFEYNPQERAAKERIRLTAELLDKNKHILEKVSNLMSGISDTDKMAQIGSMGDLIDAKNDELITTAIALESLGENDLISLRKEYQDVDGLTQRILDDTISDEEKSKLIDSFLHRTDNVSVSNMSEEDAWAQIQENAKKFSEVRTYLKERKAVLDKTPRYKKLPDIVKYQLISTELQYKNLSDRMHSITEELGLSRDLTTTSATPNYTAKYGKNSKVKVQQRVNEENIKTTKFNIASIKSKIYDKKQSLKKAGRKNGQQLQDEITSLELALKNLEREMEEFLIERKQLQEAESIDIESTVLSTEEILALPANELVTILDPKNINNYTYEQQKTIQQTLDLLRSRDISAEDKIWDLRILSEKMEVNQDAIRTLMTNPEYLEIYAREKRRRRVWEYWRAEIISSSDYLATKISEANSDEEIINTALQYSGDVVSYFIDTHPEYEDLLEPLIPLCTLHRDIVNILESMYGKDKSKRGALSRLISPVISNRNLKTVEEVMSSLEDILDKPGDPLLKKELEIMLEMLEQVNYQRDATKVQSRKERQEAKKRAEEEEAKRLEEEQRRKEEELKKAKEDLEKEAPIPTVEQFEEAPKEDVILEGEKDKLPIKSDEEQFKDYTDKEVIAFFKEKEDFRRTNREAYDSTPDNIKYKIDELSHKALDYSMGITKDSSEEIKKADRRKTINELIEITKDTPYESLVNKHFKYHGGAKTQVKVPETTTNSSNQNKEEASSSTIVLNETEVDLYGFSRKELESKTRNWGSILSNSIIREHEGVDYVRGEYWKNAEVGIKLAIAAGILPNEYSQYLTERGISLENYNKIVKELRALGINSVSDIVSYIDKNTENKSKEETEEQPKEIIVTPSKKINTTEDIEEDNPVLLSGNRVVRYDLNSLKQEGIQIPLQGKEENDRMNKVFKWLDSINSNYQDVIDHELTRILKANPKIQLMMTWDKDADDEIFEVVEYTDKVKKIHPEDKGGIISSNGKKYLIIGRLGYNKNNTPQYNSYISIKDALKIERGTLRKNDPTARFMVSEKYHTEISQISSGYLTRALVGEDVALRSLKELINDPKRNPRGIPSIKDLSWGIMTPEGMLLIKAGRKEIAELKDSEKNIGNVFLLVESADGDYIPVYMRPQRYNDLKDSTLKTEIDNAINELTSPNYDDRQKALEILSQRLVLNPNDNYIINNAEGNTITIKKDGIVIKSFRLDDPNFSRTELIEAIKSLNARINVNKDVLNNDYLLEQYDDAGVLVTDIAKLATTDAIYSIYGMNTDGDPIIPRVPNPIEDKPSSDFTRKQEQAILYSDKLYRKVNGEFRDEYNHTVTDPTTIEQLKLLERVKQMTPVLSKGGYDYYILNSDPNNPSACKVHTKSNKVIKADREQSLKLLNDMKEAQIKEVQIKALEQVQLPEQQEVTNSYNEAIKPKEKEPKPKPTKEEKRDVNTISDTPLIQDLESKEYYNIEDIMYDVDNGYGEALMSILTDKKSNNDNWKDVPLEGDLDELINYLEYKGCSIVGISDVNAWLNQVKECL